MSGLAHDIVFVFPPANGNHGSFPSHLGAGYLRAVLAVFGIRSCQYLNPQPGTIGEVTRDLIALKPGMIGFTAYDADFPLALSIARSIKQQKPNIKIVFGGPSVTFGAKELLARHEAIDLCLLGESEETGPRVLGDLLDGIFPGGDQLGVAFRRNGEIVCTGLAPLLGAGAVSAQSVLDATPSPYLNGMLEDGHTGLLTGRGCTHQCQYCCFAALGRRKLRLHSVERVLAELEFIAAHQKRTGQNYVVPFHDDAFTLLPSRAKTLCEMIVRQRWKLPLSAITRADAVDDELLKLMRAAGFVSLAFGLESAVPSVLRATGKVRPPNWPDADFSPERRFVEQVRQSVISAKKLGFTVGVSIILGLPTEKATDGEATLRFIKTLPLDYYIHNFLWLFPGTPLWETHTDYGLGCSLTEMGLPTTTEYAYDVNGLSPRPKCMLETDARLVRVLTEDAINDCEAPSPSRGSISTVVIEAEQLTAGTAAWLQEILAVGGVVLQIYPPLKHEEREMRIYRDRCTMVEHLVPVRHYIQVERTRRNARNAGYGIACSGVDLYRKHKPTLVSIASMDGPSPLFDWLRGTSPSCELCDVSPDLLQSAEFGRLTKRMDAEPGGSPLQRMPIPPRFRYPGRWLKGSASCKSLNRLEVDSQGNVRSCRFGDPLGEVGDSKKDFVKRFSELARAAERRRGCHRCPRGECPRCPFPGLDDRTYCSTIMRRAPALRTLNSIRMYSRLPSAVTRQLDRMAAE
jgi:anaerobic magnesium-protoporphyrin IX monomethyl ester cyclase